MDSNTKFCYRIVLTLYVLHMIQIVLVFTLVIYINHMVVKKLFLQMWGWKQWIANCVIMYFSLYSASFHSLPYICIVF